MDSISDYYYDYFYEHFEVEKGRVLLDLYRKLLKELDPEIFNHVDHGKLLRLDDGLSYDAEFAEMWEQIKEIEKE